MLHTKVPWRCPLLFVVATCLTTVWQSGAEAGSFDEVVDRALASEAIPTRELAHAILEISPGASQRDIDRAHKRLAVKVFPRTGTEPTLAFKLVQAAYDFLSATEPVAASRLASDLEVQVDVAAKARGASRRPKSGGPFRDAGNASAAVSPHDARLLRAIRELVRELARPQSGALIHRNLAMQLDYAHRLEDPVLRQHHTRATLAAMREAQVHHQVAGAAANAAARGRAAPRSGDVETVLEQILRRDSRFRSLYPHYQTMKSRAPRQPRRGSR